MPAVGQASNAGRWSWPHRMMGWATDFNFRPIAAVGSRLHPSAVDFSQKVFVVFFGCAVAEEKILESHGGARQRFQPLAVLRARGSPCTNGRGRIGVLARFIQEDAVLVAAHGGHVQFHEHLRRAARVQGTVQAIAQVDHVADAAAADVVQNGFQRPAIAVNVRQNGDGRVLHGGVLRSALGAGADGVQRRVVAQALGFAPDHEPGMAGFLKTGPGTEQSARPSRSFPEPRCGKPPCRFRWPGAPAAGRRPRRRLRAAQGPTASRPSPGRAMIQPLRRPSLSATRHRPGESSARRRRKKPRSSPNSSRSSAHSRSRSPGLQAADVGMFFSLDLSPEAQRPADLLEAQAFVVRDRVQVAVQVDVFHLAGQQVSQGFLEQHAARGPGRACACSRPVRR